MKKIYPRTFINHTQMDIQHNYRRRDKNDNGKIGNIQKKLSNQWT